jgi:hypothetical protein
VYIARSVHPYTTAHGRAAQRTRPAAALACTDRSITLHCRNATGLTRAFSNAQLTASLLKAALGPSDPPALSEARPSLLDEARRELAKPGGGGRPFKLRRTAAGVAAAAAAGSEAVREAWPTEDKAMRLVTALAHLFPEVGASS